MILSVTMNPSIDISYQLDQFHIDEVNRALYVNKTAGGKGLNVARVLKCSGNNVNATGLIGGYNGQYIQKQLDKDGIEHNFSYIESESRNCIAILHEGKQTEILESGPIISENEQLKFISHFPTLAEKSSLITISGSLPRGISDDFYAKLIAIANKLNKKIVLDCSGSTLKKSLLSESVPFLIKPNLDEFNALFETNYLANDLVGLKQTLLNHEWLLKIKMVIVTLGKDGAIAKINDQLFKVTIPKIDVVNPVGSGDATIAGLSVGILHNDKPEDILKRGMCFGMLNTMEKQTGFINVNNYSKLFESITVTEF